MNTIEHWFTGSIACVYEPEQSVDVYWFAGHWVHARVAGSRM